MTTLLAPFELLHRVRSWGQTTPTKPAYVDALTGQILDYCTLADQVAGLSGAVAAQIPAGATVILQCGNRIEYAIWFLALLAGGINVCPVLPELTEIEVNQLGRRIGAAAIVGQRWTIDYALQGHGESFESFVNPAGDLLLASSGTTGLPKVVQRTIASLDCVSQNMVRAIGFTADDYVLAAVPLSHSYGLEHGLLAPLWAGCTVHLCEGMNFPIIARELAERITVFPTVPPMIEMLATLADGPVSLQKLRIAYSAGGPLPAAVHLQFQRRYGARIGQVYGMTEIGSVTFNSPLAEPFDSSSVGRMMTGVSVRVLGIDTDRATVPIDVEGEIAVRAPSMFSGYLGETESLIDGHFRTGDLGRLDAEGQLHITGRVRLLIDAAGMKVNPIEVESVICDHPDVVACMVVPVRQSETVHRLCAVIVPRDADAPPTTKSIRGFAKSRLAAYKVPRLIKFRRELPRSSTGKVLRQRVEASL